MNNQDIFVYGVVVPVFPFYLTDHLHVHDDDVQRWILLLLSVYGAAVAVIAPLCEMVASLLRTRRIILLAAGLVLGASTILVCLARSLPGLVCGRLLQGFATAVTWMQGQALLVDTLGKEASGRAMGLVSSSMSLGFLVAPLLGGVMYDQIGYRAMYGVTIGFIMVDCCLRLLLIERGEVSPWQSSDEPRGTLCTAATDVVSFPSPTMICHRNLSGVSRVRSIWHTLITGRVWSGFLGLSMMTAQLTALDTTVPKFVEHRFLFDSLGAGLLFLAPLGPVLLGGPVVGKFDDSLWASVRS